MSDAVSNTSTYRLRSLEFRKEREAAWTELEALVTRVEKDGLPALGPDELTRLPMLYRTAISSLSVAREISLDRNVTEYLESLTARAYFAVYGPKEHVFDALGTFFRESFPRAVRAHARLVLVSAAVLVAGALTAFLLILGDPQYFHVFVDEDYANGRGPDATTQELREVLYDVDRTPAEKLAAFSIYLFNRNAGNGILCFGLGFAAGLPTLLLLFINGLILGAFAALYHQRGLDLELWAWILPHGVIEISAVLLCGAAGLAVGRALLFPGGRTRLASLTEGGRQGARVVVGAVVMFLVAGLVEGVFRQTVHDVGIRFAVAFVNASLLGLYLVRAGREVSRG